MTARITRRLLLSLAAAFVAAPASAQNDAAVAFVRDFYAKEIARHVAKERAADEGFLAVFTADALKLWRDAQANPNKGQVPLGSIRHVFLGSGALPGREVRLGAVTSAGGGRVAVALIIQGNPRKLMVTTVREGGALKFADIDYGDGESFVAYFRKLAGR